MHSDRCAAKRDYSEPPCASCSRRCRTTRRGFYGRVGRELERQGHEVAHLTFSPRGGRSTARARSARPSAARAARRGGIVRRRREEIERIERQYDTPDGARHLADGRGMQGQAGGVVHRLDRAPLPARSSGSSTSCSPTSWCPRSAARRCAPSPHLVGLERGDHRALPDVHDLPATRCACTRTRCTRRSSTPDDVRPLEPQERGEIERVHRAVHDEAQADPPVPGVRLDLGRAADARSATSRERARERPRQPVPAPGRWAARRRAREGALDRCAGGSTQQLDPERPFVYFPLHVTDDYKIKRLIPHCVDQAAIIEQVADALPHGLRRRAQGAPDVDRAQLARHAAPAARDRNVRLVDPYTSSHELIQARGRRSS